MHFYLFIILLFINYQSYKYIYLNKRFDKERILMLHVAIKDYLFIIFLFINYGLLYINIFIQIKD